MTTSFSFVQRKKVELISNWFEMMCVQPIHRVSVWKLIMSTQVITHFYTKLLCTSVARRALTKWAHFTRWTQWTIFTFDFGFIGFQLLFYLTAEQDGRNKKSRDFDWKLSIRFAFDRNALFYMWNEKWATFRFPFATKARSNVKWFIDASHRWCNN